MSINRSDAFRHILCMDLQPDALRYAATEKSSGKITQKGELNISQFDRESVTSTMTDELFSFDYDGFVLTAGGDRNTLIPVDLFNHAKPADVFKLNYPKPFDNLDYNRIPEIGIVNIYELPLWIKSLFVIKFPRVKIVHPATVLLKGLFNQSIWSPKMHIYLRGGSFYLVLTAKNKMNYFNRFEFTNLADMVYHILFVMEQKEIEQKDIELHLYGTDHDWKDMEEFQEFFQNKIKVSDSDEGSKDFILSQQLLCV